jgi:DNA polymerase III epsilon subunit-like protein
MKDDILLLITDVETTGLDFKKEYIIELAAVLYSMKLRTVLQQWSTLMYAPSNPVEHINHISQASLDAVSMVDVQPEVLYRMAFDADAFVGHNIEFDRNFILTWGKGFLVDGRPFPSEKPWICTYKEIVWNKPTVKKKLNIIAEAHGIPLGGEHRALFDCNLIAQLFSQLPNLEEQIKNLIAKKRS